MPLQITLEDLASITDTEVAFSTTRLLPEWNQIPDEFQKGNTYTRLAEAVFFGRDLPDCDIELKEGVTPELINKAVRAHLQSLSPKHENKIASVGYMIAQLATLMPRNKPAQPSV